MRAPLAFSLALTSLLPLAGSTAFAADTPRSGVVGLEAMTSTVFQEGQSSFSGLAFRMHVRSVALRPEIEVMPTIEYWQNTNHLDAFSITTRRRDATLGCDARWLFHATGWDPYAGVGYSLHFLGDEVDAPRQGIPHATNGVVKGGLDLLGGAEFSMGTRLGSFLELKLLNVTRYRQIKFNTGLSWAL